MLKILLYTEKEDVKGVFSFLLNTLQYKHEIFDLETTSIDHLYADIHAFKPNIVLMEAECFYTYGVSMKQRLQRIRSISFLLEMADAIDLEELADIDNNVVKCVIAEDLLKQLLLKVTAQHHLNIDTKSIQNVITYYKSSNDSHDQYELTRSEKKVLNQLVDGGSYKIIASSLSLSVETVKTHIRNIYRKLGVNNSASAVALSIRKGLV